MESVIEFLETNYVYVIIGAVVIIMAIIGYFADKSQKSNKKPIEEKPDDKVKEVEFIDEIKQDDTPVVPEDWNSLPSDEEENETVELDSEPSVESDPEPSVEPNWDDNEMENWDEETKTEETDFAFEEKQPEVTEDNFNDKPENDEVSDTDDSKEIEEPVYEDIQEDEFDIDNNNNDVDDLEITLPSIETLNEEIKDVEDDDDVWKF